MRVAVPALYDAVTELGREEPSLSHSPAPSWLLTMRAESQASVVLSTSRSVALAAAMRTGPVSSTNVTWLSFPTSVGPLRSRNGASLTAANCTKAVTGTLVRFPSLTTNSISRVSVLGNPGPDSRFWYVVLWITRRKLTSVSGPWRVSTA